jgi:hypothetical protein
LPNIVPSVDLPYNRRGVSMNFYVADLNVRGELESLAEYGYAQLEQLPGAADLIGDLSGALWNSPEEFEKTLPHGRNIRLRWLASAKTAGIATVRFGEGELASFSLLASGMDADADTLTFAAFQQHLLRELRDTGIEPAFALMELRPRPIVATINFRSPDDPADQLVAALADRCFAASYFRYLHLA